MAEPTDRTFDDPEKLRAFGRCLAHFISEQATDPHLNFSTRIAGAFTVSQTDEALHSLVAELVDWTVTLEFTQAQLERLDRRLAEQRLPGFTDVRRRLPESARE